MSYTAQPSSQRLASRVFTVTVTAAEINRLSEGDFERDFAEAIAERLESPTTVKVEELPS